MAKAKAKAKAAAGRAPPAPKRAAAPKGRAAAPKVPPLALQHSFCDKAKEYEWDKCEALLAEHPGLLDVQPAGRWSALHQFAASGNTEAVKKLLDLGANRAVTTSDGKTPEEVAHEDCKACFEEEAEAEAEAEEEEAEEEEEAAERAPAPVAEEPPKGAKRKAPEPKAAAEASSSSPAPAAPPAKKAKGGRPVDAGVPDRSLYSVVGDWSVLLNQTNVGANNNKYYKIQLLSHTSGSFHCWTHWGRVGACGQNQMATFGNQAGAEAMFKSKFKQKSSVAYDNLATHDWTPKVGKYTYVETEEGEGGEGGDSAPLGKLTVQQIEKGQSVLAKINDVLGRPGKVPTASASKLNDLSSEFYTLVPHNFGFKVPPAINTKDMLEAEEELLKFYLRMGFEEIDKTDDGLSPISGIMDLALPPSLDAAASGLCTASSIKASNDKGKTHAGKQSGGPSQKMEAHLYACIMLYTSNAIYRDLNNVLRSEDRSKIIKYFKYLRLLLEALGRLPQQEKTLWRGVSVDLYDQYKVGSTITWWGVSSCTADQQVAKNFMKGCGGKCTLLTVKTRTAADISSITFFGNEKENLLAPGTQLKVLSSKREGKVSEITLQEVDRVLK